MTQKAIQTIKPALEEVQDRFGIWRKTRKKANISTQGFMESLDRANPRSIRGRS